MVMDLNPGDREEGRAAWGAAGVLGGRRNVDASLITPPSYRNQEAIVK